MTPEVEAVVKAWTDLMQDRLRRDWPVLARALDRLAVEARKERRS